MSLSVFKLTGQVGVRQVPTAPPLIQGTEVNLHEDNYEPTVLKDVMVPTSVAAFVPAEPVDHGEQLATLLETNCAHMRRSMMVWFLQLCKDSNVHAALMHSRKRVCVGVV